MATRYWLFKSEPDAFSIDDLKRCPKKTSLWDGVRNYQARNFLRDEVQKGDGVIFYHSSCKLPGIAGLAEVVKSPYPDPTAFDSSEKYFDPKSDPDNPTWFTVDIKFKKALTEVIDRQAIAGHPILKDMKVMRRGMRLSIIPVEAREWKAVLKLIP